MSENEKPERVAIVTGASSGIGEAAARCLAKAGFSVVLAARRADLLDSIVADINAQGGKALSVPTDLSDAEQTSALVQAALDALGGSTCWSTTRGTAHPTRSSRWTAGRCAMCST
jgi:NADP-dependent 3-hydroxy acid dehydrogenase YdfG